jgi:electron transport complex protein RnfE
MKLAGEFSKGLWKENAVFKLVLGMCPTLAVTTSAVNGLGMGLATTFVLVCSNVAVALLRRVIPAQVRIPAYIVIIASFVTVVQLGMEAYTYQLYKALGIFIPLIVVNCLILARAEAFASKNPVLPAVVDGIGMGCGFTLALFLLGAVRELAGSGSFLGVPLLGAGYVPFLLLILPPGAFIALGLLLGGMNRLEKR